MFHLDTSNSAELIPVLKRLLVLHCCMTWNILQGWSANKPCRVRLYGHIMHLKFCTRRPWSIAGAHACSSRRLYWELRVYEALQNDWLSRSLLDCSMCDMAANFTREVPVQQDDRSRTNKPSPHISKVTTRTTPHNYNSHNTNIQALILFLRYVAHCDQPTTL
jgi:hypothetical protein